MTYLIQCPACQQDGLDPRYSPTACIHCKKEFTIVGFCPTCHAELQKFQCCAVNFFCTNCNELLSKKRVDFHVTPVSGKD